MTKFDRRIARAKDLQAKFPESAALLEFYGQVIALQKSVSAELGSVSDVRSLAKFFPPLVRLVESSAPEPLVRFAHDHLTTPEAGGKLLDEFWNTREETDRAAQFFARLLLQPYAEWLASRADVSSAASGSACPFCASKPVLSIRRGEGDGARRSLLCSLCSLEWPYRRILCPGCGEEQKDNLPVFSSGTIDYVRVEACDRCHAYLKSIDLTKQGLAVAEVDEVATVALDVWAEQNGYSKLETNLLGM